MLGMICGAKIFGFLLRSISIRMALAFGQGDVSQAFAEKMGRIYGSSTFGKSSSRAPEARAHRSAKQHGLALNCDGTWLDVPTKSDNGSLEFCPWPILLPKDLMVALIEAGHLEMLMGTLQERQRYWEQAFVDFSGHDALDADTIAPLNLYGDESTVFRSSCMCLHWEPVLHHFRGDSMLSRILIAIIPSERYWIAPDIYIYISYQFDFLWLHCCFFCLCVLAAGLLR